MSSGEWFLKRKSELAKAEHPAWSTIRICVGMICITVVLAVNATNFDESEYRAIGWIGGLAVGGEFAMRQVRKLLC